MAEVGSLQLSALLCLPHEAGALNWVYVCFNVKVQYYITRFGSLVFKSFKMNEIRDLLCQSLYMHIYVCI